MAALFLLRVIQRVASLLVFLFIPLLSISAAAQTQNPIFPVTAFYPEAGVGGLGITAGDFNGDGLSDIAYLWTPPDGTQLPAIAVVLGYGTSAAPTAVITDGLKCTANGLVPADMNGDKKLDLVLTCKEGYVVVLLGNGDGSFQLPSYYSVPGVGKLAAPVDLNGDGYPDVIVTSQSSAVSVLLNQGSGAPGTLSAVKSYAGPSGLALSSIGVGDFNGDGKQDILAGSTQLAIFYGNGDGTLQAPQATSATGVFESDDFNNDGLTDIAYVAVDAATSDSTLQILLGNSSGTLTDGPNLSLGNCQNYYALVPAGSTNVGSNSDLALLGSNTTILLGDGKGGFTLGGSYDLTGSGVATEIESSGKANLVFSVTDSLAFLQGNGDGTFQGLPNTALNAGSLATADLNGDGLTDVLALDGNGDLVSALGRGNGMFSVASQISGIGEASLLIAGDFNGDGKADAVLLRFGKTTPNGLQDANVLFYGGNGDGTFQPSATTTDFNTLAVEGGAVAGDFNGDSNLDLILYLLNPDAEYSVLLFLAGKGNGAFSAPVTISQQNSFVSDPPLTADLNNDKKLYLVWNGIVYLGNGDGTFTQMPLGLTGTVLAVGDLNGDGVPDLVIGPSVYAGNGDGTFQSSPFYTAPLPSNMDATQVTSASIGDLNADGRPDLLLQYATSSDSAEVGIYFGDGKGGFTADNNVYYAGFNPDGFPGTLARLNNQAPAFPNDNALDYLAYREDGVTSLLNRINPAPAMSAPQASKITLSASASGGIPGQQLTFAATVTGFNPTGNVSFVSGSTILGTVAVADGVASLATSFAATGIFPVTANYEGDSSNLPRTSNAISISISADVSLTAITASANSANEHQQLVFTAMVTGINPTGNVSFLSAGSTLGTVAVTNGMAALLYSFTVAGNYSITANYSGDSVNLPSTSNAVSISVAAPDFTVSISPSSATIVPGQSAAITVTLTPVGGYAGTAAFSCGPLPSEATCSFAPSSLAVSGSTASSTLTISTTAPVSASLRDGSGYMEKIAWAGLVCFFFPSRRLWRLDGPLGRSVRLVILLIGSLIFISSCGGSYSASSSGNPGTPTGTQSITVSVTDSASEISHSIPFKITVL